MGKPVPLSVLLRQFMVPTTCYRVSKLLNVSHSSVLKRVHRLERRGYLVKVGTTPTNIPGNVYVLTEKGKKLLELLEDDERREHGEAHEGRNI